MGENECICFGGAQCLTLNVTENEINEAERILVITNFQGLSSEF